MQMLSATVRSGMSESSWNTQAMPAASASRGPPKPTGRPSRNRSPASGLSTPAMILISVLLPAPFSPSTAWIEPARPEKSTSLRAWTPPNALPTPIMRQSAAASAGASLGDHSHPRRCGAPAPVIILIVSVPALRLYRAKAWRRSSFRCRKSKRQEHCNRRRRCDQHDQRNIATLRLGPTLVITPFFQCCRPSRRRHRDRPITRPDQDGLSPWPTA